VGISPCPQVRDWLWEASPRRMDEHANPSMPEAGAKQGIQSAT